VFRILLHCLQFTSCILQVPCSISKDLLGTNLVLKRIAEEKDERYYLYKMFCLSLLSSEVVIFKC